MKSGRSHAKISVVCAVWSSCNLELEVEASQKIGKRNNINLIGDSY